MGELRDKINVRPNNSLEWTRTQQTCYQSHGPRAIQFERWAAALQGFENMACVNATTLRAVNDETH
ncbi:MAG TPA: hypothetical protein VGN95_25220 [Pyrinomonadaceae bacterium]|jgi:hypothetical protein|nr:hypothetical protein [Pyrinomonadaceae bacterium]